MSSLVGQIALGASILLSGLIAGVGPGFLRWRRQIICRLQANSRVVETASGPVEFAEIGDGLPVLMIHGTPGGYDQVLEAVKAGEMSSSGLRIITPSRPGYLRTPLESGRTPAEQARLYSDLLDHLGLPKAFILGASGGGPSAIQFAILYPEQCAGLILEEAVTRSIRVDRSAIAPLLVDVLIYVFRKQAIAAVQAHDPRDPVLAKLAAQSLDTLVPHGRRLKGVDNDRVQFADMGGWPLHAIRCPTLILHGVLDKDVPLADAEFAHAQIAGSELIKLEGADHSMVVTRYKELNALIAAFIARSQPALQPSISCINEPTQAARPS